MSERWLGWLTSNPWTKLLSLVLALVTWLYVQGDEVHEDTVKATVVWSLPPDLVSAEPLPTTVSLEVRGTRASIRRAGESVVRVPVDLTDIGVGEHGLEFGSFDVEGLPPSVQVLGIQPSAVRFTLDEQIERKVKIKPVLLGDPGAGFEVHGTTFDPPVVDVRGPRSAVEPLVEVSTQPIDVSGLVADTTAEVALDLPRMVELATDVIPTATIEVVPTVVRQTIGAVQVHVWGRYDFVPEVSEVTVTLEGPSDELEAFDRQNVVAFVHLPQQAERSRYEAWFGPQEGVRVRVLHPGGQEVKVIGVQPPTIAVEKQ